MSPPSTLFIVCLPQIPRQLHGNRTVQFHRSGPRAYNGAWHRQALHTHVLNEKKKKRITSPIQGMEKGSSVSWGWAAAISGLWDLQSCPPSRALLRPSARARGPGAKAAPPYPCPAGMLRLMRPHLRAGTPGRWAKETQLTRRLWDAVALATTTVADWRTCVLTG